MSKLNLIIKMLKQQKYKITKKRKTIIEILTKSPVPCSVPDIQKTLASMHSTANKTTIYRQLAFLKSKNIIRQIQLGDKIMRYEINSPNHHHHIVCVNCKKIEDVELEKDVEKAEKIIKQTKNFKILHHTLEFYGLCGKCQTIQSQI